MLAEYEGVVWKPWQQALLDSLQLELTSQWIWDSKGNIGKSHLTAYLLATGRAALLTAGRKADMAYTLSTRTRSAS